MREREAADDKKKGRRGGAAPGGAPASGVTPGRDAAAPGRRLRRVARGGAPVARRPLAAGVGQDAADPERGMGVREREGVRED